MTGSLRRIYLVRHGLPAVDRQRPAHEWPLDPTGVSAIDELRGSGRIPTNATWFSSPEPKALATARRLTGRDVPVVEDLREHERHSMHWFPDPTEFRAVVRRAFASPDEPAFPGWEPLGVTRDRVVSAVRRLLGEHPAGDVVLVGHGTAWTLLRAELLDVPPDLDAWSALAMPDVWTLDVPPRR